MNPENNFTQKTEFKIEKKKEIENFCNAVLSVMTAILSK